MRRRNTAAPVHCREMFDETDGQTKGLITQDVGIRVESASETVLSGPHIYGCNPFYQEVPADYRNKQDFVLVDLLNIGETFYPRTIYKLGKKAAHFGDDVHKYRNARRKMVFPMAERSLATALIPPEMKHINGIISMCFEDYEDLLNFTGLTNSLVYDFFVKITNKTNITEDVIGILPYKKSIDWRIRSRVLRLNCLTEDFSDLWAEFFDERFSADQFTKNDLRLSPWNMITKEWSVGTPLRNALERRQALLEIDVLVAIELGLKLDNLLTIYNVQFPILNKNERDTWYDQRGQVAQSVNTAYSETSRKKIVEKWDGRSLEPVEGLCPPFDKCEREEDYAIAWQEFEKRLGK